MKKILTIAILLNSFVTYSQEKLPPLKDTIALPFAIADEKRLSDEDLNNKKEGFYFTAVPDISSDPVNGFGYGVEGSLFFNGNRKDPFFAYTPYRSRLDIALFNTNRDQREVAMKLDIPYIFNTKWRLRLEGVYEVNPNLLYFGTNASSLNILQHPTTGKTYSNYSDYENALSHVRKGFANEANIVTDKFYNQYKKEEVVLNASIEHSYLKGKVRLLVGYEMAYVTISSFDGKDYSEAIDDNGKTITAPNGITKLKQDNDAHNITGYGSALISMLQAGIVYDTRDLETDPSKGVFAEITNEFSNGALASAYNFNKIFAHAKYYHTLFPHLFKRLVLACRIGAGYTAGNAPFFEYQDQWSSEGSIEGLGGAHTLRGYKQARFLGRMMNFANIEFRWRFANALFLKQHLAFSAVPFIDIGGVWNDFNILSKVSNYRYSPGLGARIAWNVNTILRFDYAISNEDAQFFFNIGHTF